MTGRVSRVLMWGFLIFGVMTLAINVASVRYIFEFRDRGRTYFVHLAGGRVFFGSLRSGANRPSESFGLHVVRKPAWDFWWTPIYQKVGPVFGGSYRYWVSVWPLPCACFAAYAAGALMSRRRNRKAPSMCDCGYCLVGNESGTCPECGAPVNGICLGNEPVGGGVA